MGMAFCGSSHHTANQRTPDLFTTFLLVIIIVGYVLTDLNCSSLKIKFASRTCNAVIYTSNPAGPFKAPSCCHISISHTSTI